MAEDCLSDTFVRSRLEGFAKDVTRTLRDIPDDAFQSPEAFANAVAKAEAEEPLRRALRETEEALESALLDNESLRRELKQLRREFSEAYQLYQKRLLRG
jgi:hypothetical protein